MRKLSKKIVVIRSIYFGRTIIRAVQIQNLSIFPCLDTVKFIFSLLVSNIYYLSRMMAEVLAKIIDKPHQLW